MPHCTALAGLLVVVALAFSSGSSAEWWGDSAQGLPDYSAHGGSPQLLNDGQRIEISEYEREIFESYKGRDTYYKEPGYEERQRVWYEIFTASFAADSQRKKSAVAEAVQVLAGRGVRIPYGLRVYCTSNPQAENRAFPRITTLSGGRLTFEPVAYVTLSQSGGIPGSIADQQNRYGATTVSVIHEIGHILHERDAGDSYWLMRSPGAANTAGQVSAFAAGSTRAEFVAEVFAGRVLGMNFSPEVMAEYASYRGPKVP